MLCNFIEITFRQGCSSVDLLHIFRTPFPKNIPEGLFLSISNNIKPAVKFQPSKNKRGCLPSFITENQCKDTVNYVVASYPSGTSKSWNEI